MHEPTDDAQRMLEDALTAEGLVLGDHGLWCDPLLDVGVLAHRGHAVVGWIELKWTSPAPPPALELRDPVYVPASPHRYDPIDQTAVQSAIDTARAAGAARRQTCRYCGRSLHPGHMHGNVRHGCAERHLGIVH